MVIGLNVKVIVLPERTSIIMIFPPVWVMGAMVSRTSKQILRLEQLGRKQGAEHVSNLRELGLDGNIVGVLAGNGILTLHNGVSELVKTGAVGHSKTRR
jgi:hypothetical protein